MLSKVFRTALVALIGAAFIIVGGCGRNASENIRKVGPIGPTSPGGYYFTLEAAPATVQATGVVNLTVRVTNAAGVGIDGTGWAGWVHFSGSTSSGTDVTTDSKGFAGARYVCSGFAGHYAYYTATVEDKSLTVPVLIVSAP